MPMRLSVVVSLLLIASLRAVEPFIEKLDLFEGGEDPAYKSYHVPGIVVTAKGTVLVVCEARKRAPSGASDWETSASSSEGGPMTAKLGAHPGA